MKNGYEAITIKISTDHKQQLAQRVLEHPRRGMWDGPKSYADLVREAIARFLATPSKAAPAKRAKKSVRR